MIIKEFLSDIIIRQSSIIFLSSLLSNIFSLIFWLFMIRKLNHLEYGTLNSMVSFLALLGLPVSVLHAVLTRYFAEFKAQGKNEYTQALFRAFLKRITIINFIIIGLVLALSKNIINFLNLKDTYFIYFSAISVFSAISFVLASSVMQGLQLFRQIAANSIFQGIIKLSVGILLVLLGLKALGAFLGFVFASFLGFILSLYQLPSWVFKINRKDYSFHKPQIKLKELYRYFLPATLAITAYSLFINTDMILVKHFFNESEAGIYSVAQTVGKIILFLPSSIVLVFFPVSIEQTIQNKNTILLLKKSLFFMAMLSIIAALFIFLFPKFALMVVTGKALPQSISLVRFIIFQLSLFSLSYILIFYNLSLKNMHFLVYVFLISIMQIFLICIFHSSLFQVIAVLFFTSFLSFCLGLKSISKSK